MRHSSLKIDCRHKFHMKIHDFFLFHNRYLISHFISCHLIMDGEPEQFNSPTKLHLYTKPATLHHTKFISRPQKQAFSWTANRKTNSRP